ATIIQPGPTVKVWPNTSTLTSWAFSTKTSTVKPAATPMSNSPIRTTKGRYPVLALETPKRDEDVVPVVLARASARPVVARSSGPDIAEVEARALVQGAGFGSSCY